MTLIFIEFYILFELYLFELYVLNFAINVVDDEENDDDDYDADPDDDNCIFEE